MLADRMSVNLELPTAESLRKLAPHKSRKTILAPMRQIQMRMEENRHELAVYRQAPRFVPAGQSTQMIIGATPESDFEIVSVAESLYQKFQLKRVFYSAFVQVNQDSSLPTLPGAHRFCGSTGCTRRTGCCAFMDLRRQSCSVKSGQTSTCFWTPSATGRFLIWVFSSGDQPCSLPNSA